MKGDNNMSIIQTFYDNLASQYDKLFLDWQAETQEQAEILDRIFISSGFDKTSKILDCACGIGTQAIGLANIGYNVTCSDISDGEIVEAKDRAAKNNVRVRFEHADFCALSDTFTEKFDIIIAMDNALPHMLTSNDLNTAITLDEQEQNTEELKDAIKKDGANTYIASFTDGEESKTGKIGFKNVETDGGSVAFAIFLHTSRASVEFDIIKE